VVTTAVEWILFLGTTDGVGARVLRTKDMTLRSDESSITTKNERDVGNTSMCSS
jgi:hypothetical protein